MVTKKYDGTIYASNSNQGMSCPCCGEPWGKMREVVFDEDNKRLKEIYCSNCVSDFKLEW